ncbi:hypothetical protein N9112_00040 [bacterium]|nr:hypothetical protein [bacterium]
MDKLKTLLPFLVVLVTVSVAWGEQRIKIVTLEDAFVRQEALQEEFTDLRVQSAVITKSVETIVKSQDRQAMILERLSRQLSTLERDMRSASSE